MSDIEKRSSFPLKGVSYNKEIFITFCLRKREKVMKVCTIKEKMIEIGPKRKIIKRANVALQIFGTVITKLFSQSE